MAGDERMQETEADAAAIAAPPLLSAGRRLGSRYRLERPLGRGGMAAVWLALDERLDRPVAIKILSDTLAGDEEYLSRFKREARVAAGLQHPNLVSIYDFDAGGRPYLVMEYIECGDLGERIAKGELPEVAPLAAELLSALRHIHAAGVLHRDIKPQNVLIDANGHARLTDFGIAQPRDATSLTKTGNVIGTERYLAPELLAGEPASERSDLYALGVVLDEVAAAEQRQRLKRLIARLRDDDPNGRPRSAAAALAILERDTGQRRIEATATMPLAEPPLPPAGDTPPRPTPFEPPQQRPHGTTSRRVLWLAGLLALLVLVGVAMALTGGDDDPSRNDRGGAANAESEGGGGGEEPAEEAAPPEAAAGGAGGGAAPAPEEEEEEPAPATDDGYALNDEGFALNQEGRYEEAVPVLEQAVGALEESGDEQTYNYALYNLGVAYLGAGRPEDAIEVLEQRMQYDDGQLAEVEATLNEAYDAAGVEAEDEKPGKGPKEKTPKPFEDD